MIGPLSRRDFTALLVAATASPVAATGLPRPQAPNPIAIKPVRQDWLAKRIEPILEPALPIIDPHHHLWDGAYGRYLFDDLMQDTGSGHNIVATVFIQASSMYRATGPVEMQPVGEVEFANGIAAVSASGGFGNTRACAGIVGHADLRRGGAAEPVLVALIRAGGDRLRGIRHRTVWDASLPSPNGPNLMANAAFREGFALLGRMGLSFDADLYHPQIEELAALADRFPETQIVLNHLGGPLGAAAYAGRQREVFPIWAKSINALAARPNVSLKLGGFGTGRMGFAFDQAPLPPSSQAIAARVRPYVETCIEAFGARRCMFESNFPVDKAAFSYPIFWNACKVLASGASASEKADLFAGTADRFYRLQTSVQDGAKPLAP